MSRQDESYNMLLAWVSNHQLDNAAPSVLARVDLKGGHDFDDKFHQHKPLKFVPWDTSFLFWYKCRPVSYHAGFRDRGHYKEEEISISCLGRSSKLLKDLLLECRNDYVRENKNKTSIFHHQDTSWEKSTATRVRLPSTVILNEKTKQSIIEDAREFLDPETHRLFIELGTPYRRGYLLHGYPGTGKTSFSQVIAGEFGLDVYIVSIPSVDDQTLQALFRKLPATCIVLLEDIDAVGVARTTVDCDQDRSPQKSKKCVSMSGLLNTLDGAGSKEGRILIMTTNYIEKLDVALLRPGRVDRIVEFQLADAEILASLFRLIYRKTHNSMANASHDGEDRFIDLLALEFAARMPARELSPAQLMSYLFRYRHSPTAAVDYCMEWAAATRHEKRK